MIVGAQVQAAPVDSSAPPGRLSVSCRLRLDAAGCWRVAAASAPLLTLLGRPPGEAVVGANAVELLGLKESDLDWSARPESAAEVAVEIETAIRLGRGWTDARMTLVPADGAEVVAVFSDLRQSGDPAANGTAVPADLFVRYRADLSVVECSEGYAALYGRAAPDLVGRSLIEWVSPEILRNVRSAVREVGARQIINTHEASRRLPDGSQRWYRWIELTAPVGPGQPAEIIAVGVDVTALKLARARLQDAIESINEGFCLFDRNERLVLVNQRFRDMYPIAGAVMREGMDMTELLRLCAASGELGPVEDPIAFAAQMANDIRNACNLHFQRQLANGRWILVSQQRTSDGGYVGVRTDITAVKANEAALQKARDELEAKNTALLALTEKLRAAQIAAEDSNRAKSRFLAHMSHELRTPLNGVIGFADIMRAGLFGPVEPERYRDYVELIHNSGELLLSLINDILDMSKIEAGKMELSIQRVETEPLAEACRTMVIGLARDSSVVLKVEIDPDCREIDADPRAAQQMIINLLSNAVKFTPPGGVVTLRFRNRGAQEGKAGGAAISVIDNGIGMTPEELAKAMLPFGQIDSELARQHKGTGIGLTLVKSLAELHGGTLEIVSEKGRGTTATITLPRMQRI